MHPTVSLSSPGTTIGFGYQSLSSPSFQGRYKDLISRCRNICSSAHLHRISDSHDVLSRCKFKFRSETGVNYKLLFALPAGGGALNGIEPVPEPSHARPAKKARRAKNDKSESESAPASSDCPPHQTPEPSESHNTNWAQGPEGCESSPCTDPEDVQDPTSGGATEPQFEGEAQIPTTAPSPVDDNFPLKSEPVPLPSFITDQLRKDIGWLQRTVSKMTPEKVTKVVS
jgi:hypothetical protein